MMLKDGQAALQRDTCFFKINYRGVHNRVVCKHTSTSDTLSFLASSLFIIFIIYFILVM